MNCKWCNREVENNSKFCQYCGGNLINNETQENTQIIPQTNIVEQPMVNSNNINLQPNYSQNLVEEKVNIGFVILSILIPIAGLIVFLTMKETDKKTAKASGIAALISFGVSLIISVVSLFVVLNTVGNGINDFVDDTQSYIEETIETEDEHIEEIVEEEVEEEIVEEENSNSNNIVKNWTNYEVIVNDKLVKLPCNFSDFSTVTGTKMKSSQEKSYLSPNYYSLVNLYKNDNFVMHVELLNDQTEDILYTNAIVTRVSQSKFNVSVGADVISFPGGLTAGQEITKDEIVNLLGQPSDIDNYTSDGYVSDTYKYFSDDIYTTVNYYQIKVVNGVIDELTLDHRHYE